MRCTKCGCENPSYAVVCEQCGEFLPKEDLTGTIKPEVIPEQPEIIPERPKPTVPGTVNPEATPVPKGMIRCRNCWTDNPSGTTHCASCGKELFSTETRAKADAAFDTLRKQRDAKITCVNCGATLPWNAITCSSCGKSPRVEKKDYVEYDDEGFTLLGEIIKAAVTPRASTREFRASDYVIREAPEDSEWVNYSTAGKVRCRTCWEFNPPGTKVCQTCGAHLSSKSRIQASGRKLCTCGYKNLPKVTVCLKCGGRIVDEEVVQPQERKVCTCGYPNLPGVTICLKCGGRILKKCSLCGYENPANVTICGKCKKKI